MTLSYRWGSHPKILLKSSSLESFKSENSIGQLPLTFRDAICVVRHFGIRYLWVDSLCIIQDSVPDWEAEAPMMRYVYGNSTCNLAATASYDPDEGLFRERDPAKIGPHVVESTLTNGSLQKSLIVTVGYWENQINDGVYHKRGWVFQECLLAPRVMYFTKEQLMWECTETHGCEAFPDGVNLRLPTKLDVEKAFENNGAKFVNFDLSSSYAHSGVWMYLVKDYTLTKLTRPDDRLYAFSGIAKLFQEITGYKYLAGLWQEDLLHQLGWFVHCPAPKLSNRYKAPSWSWASTDGWVEPNSAHDMEFLIQIIDVKVTARGTDPTLDAADGYLKLRCPFIVTTYFRTSEGKICLEIGGTNARSLTFSDYKPDRQEEQGLTENGTIGLFFYVRNIFDPDSSWIKCIAVESIPGDDDAFRRTGMISMYNQEAVKAAMDMIEDGTIGSKTITLV
ncbi:heterokaryon incompatibility protein [Colletotrichum kahawae]|uniref:Heterokaryon incompatibility protein n=1 Tax=Colletotrichum kahawae TaxID=34407 RepID=A0AAD9YSX2_COLKA|nr:heterokaryon incompatibility protein [Colletotrichum kahawae]